MYCPPGHIAEDTLPAVQFHITRYQRNPVFLKKAVLLLVPPTVCSPSAHPVSDVGCLRLLYEQARITVQTNRGLFFIPSARRVVSARSLGSSRCAAEGWPEQVVTVGGERCSLWSERIWADTQRWPQRFRSVAASQPGAEGSDL